MSPILKTHHAIPSQILHMLPRQTEITFPRYCIHFGPIMTIPIALEVSFQAKISTSRPLELGPN